MKNIVAGNKKILGVVVLFEPDIHHLQKLFDSVSNQVNAVIFVDNSKVSNLDIINNLREYSSIPVIYKYLNDNKGIAIAQNIGIQYCLVENYSHVLLLDQDSILPDTMVDKLFQAEYNLISAGKNVGAVGPSYIDVKTGVLSGAISCNLFGKKIKPLNKNSIETTDYLISSGTLIRNKILKKIGVMDEKLFIDLVDSEWCERSRMMGFDCYIVGNAILEHSIGDSSTTFMGKNVTIHNDIRHYYMVRNSLYLILYKKISIRYKMFLLTRLPSFVLLHLLLSKNKKTKISLFYSAIIDGLMKKMYKCSFKC